MTDLITLDFETGDFSQFNEQLPTTPRIAIASVAAACGTNYGLTLDFNATDTGFNGAAQPVLTQSSVVELHFHADVDNAGVLDSQYSVFMDFTYDGTNAGAWGGFLYQIFGSIGIYRPPAAGVNRLYFQYHDDDHVLYTYAGFLYLIGSPDNYIIFRATRASSSGATDGILSFSLDGGTTFIDYDTTWKNYNILGQVDNFYTLEVYASTTGVGASPLGTIYLDQIFITNSISDHACPGSSTLSQMLLSMSGSLLGGDYIWNTAWVSGELYLQRRMVLAAGSASQFDFGAATESELNADTYRMSVVAYDDNHIFVFGRFNHPTLGLTHIAYTTDGGTTWIQPAGTSWATDICAGLRVDAAGVGYAIRTTAAGAPKLYAGTTTMQYASTLDMPSGTTIHQKAVVLGFDGVMYVGGLAPAGNVVVVKSNKSKGGWTDITGELSMTNINALTSLE